MVHSIYSVGHVLTCMFHTCSAHSYSIRSCPNYLIQSSPQSSLMFHTHPLYGHVYIHAPYSQVCTDPSMPQVLFPCSIHSCSGLPYLYLIYSCYTPCSIHLNIILLHIDSVKLLTDHLTHTQLTTPPCFSPWHLGSPDQGRLSQIFEDI
jgi:hypothetical protein